MNIERYHKIRAVLAQRQIDLTVCMEQVHKTHNLSAILRSCDAVGIQYAHAIWNGPEYIGGDTAAGSQRWVDVVAHDSVDHAITHLKLSGMQVLVTAFSDHAVDYREVDYTRPTAIVLGQEKYGVTEAAKAQADQHVVIPMMGMVQSLNVSAAAAIILAEAQRQRQTAGMYDSPSLSESECERVIFQACYPRYHAMCLERKLPLPNIDAEGFIAASDSWWRAMRVAPESV